MLLYSPLLLSGQLRSAALSHRRALSDLGTSRGLSPLPLVPLQNCIDLREDLVLCAEGVVSLNPTSVILRLDLLCALRRCRAVG